jgi:ArsR family transcriptional regulator
MIKHEIVRRAEMLKALAHPDRLFIIRGLHIYKCNVGQIQEKLGLSQSGLSQHLAKLKSVGIISGERNGKEICYRVVDDLALDIVERIFSGIPED